MSMSALKPEWEKFIREYVRNGGNGRAAYKAAYPNASDHTADARASALLKRDKVRIRYEELTRKAANKVVKEVADKQIESAQADDYAATLLAEAIETIRKIHTGEICDEQQELGEDGEWKVTRRTSRAADRQRAAEKIIEMYGGATNNTVRVELIGGAEDLAD